MSHSAAASSSSADIISAAVAQAAESEQELRTLERTIFDIETSYLGAGSNLLTGWSDFAKTLFVASADGAVEPAHRVFSLSSLSSPLGAAPWPRSLRAVLDAPRVVIVVNKSHKKQPHPGGAAADTNPKRRKH